MSDEVWLTYVELGKALGITTTAARSLAKRHKWPRRIPNAPGSAALVLVPPDRLRLGIDLPRDLPMVPLDPGSIGDRSEVDQEIYRQIDGANDPGSDPWTGLPVMFTTMQKIVEILHAELSTAKERALQAERRVDDLQGEIRQLTAMMAEQQSSHREVVEALVARIPTRHRWWRWSR